MTSNADTSKLIVKFIYICNKVNTKMLGQGRIVFVVKIYSGWLTLSRFRY